MGGINITGVDGDVYLVAGGNIVGGNSNEGGHSTAAHESAPPKINISRLDRYAPTELIGREAELHLLNEAWAKIQQVEQGRPHILTFVALGGEGKTSLIAKWAAEMAAQDWPGCIAAFAWSFYSQGSSEQSAASSDLFLNEALIFFGDAAMAASSLGAHAKGQRLAELVGAQSSLLLFDGLEPLQYAPASPMPGELRDQGIRALLKGLAAQSRGLCLITTRYTVADLCNYHQTTVQEQPLTRLSREAGIALLQELGVTGSLKRSFIYGMKKERLNEYEVLVEDVQGHALTLTLLGRFLCRAYHGDIRQRDRVKLEKADSRVQGGHAFRAMAAYEQWLLAEGEEGAREVAILRLMGLFDRPADGGCIHALRSSNIPGLTEPLFQLDEEDWAYSLSGLEAARLLTVNRNNAGSLLSLDAHPLLREYFAGQLQQQMPEAWQAAHRVLYHHLCETTQEGDSPTLEALQPLYQAVSHGCLAGMQQEALYQVYHARILRKDENYSTKKLGAFGTDLGALACFFDSPWHTLSPALSEADQAWLLNEAAFSLRALGRLADALEPVRAGIESEANNEHWENAARGASNLSELKLSLGLVDAAVADGALAIDYADRSSDAFQRLTRRTDHGDALWQAGEGQQAAKLFSEAEAMQAERQPGYPLLYSLAGFRYCDLLLAPAERLAWCCLLPSLSGRGGGGKGRQLSSESKVAMVTCWKVVERAKKALQIAISNKLSFLTVALDRLTLSRASFYATLLRGESGSTCSLHIDVAVDSLHRAGQLQYLPFGLLTRAWWRVVTGEAAGAVADLNEAWEIAERGPMPLFLADIHLHRARLFHAADKYPWQSPHHDLNEARRLIEETGYKRRLPELEDAEAAIM